ncbi:MAG: Holliday junction resolvase RuvX [Chloroflexota bacterium]
MTRLLGIDFGDRRVGLAIADGDGGRAMPLATIRRGASVEADAAALKEALAGARTGAIDELVVGLPLEANGDEGPQARLTREWAMAVAATLGLPVTLRDERLSSHVAEARIGPMPRGRSGGPPTRSQRDRYRSRIDREAAAIILQDELDARAGAWSAHPGARDAMENQR